ncbi:MAG: hypothetical protein ACOCWJ_00630 [Verrucomicrobiota bacterium]
MHYTAWHVCVWRAIVRALCFAGFVYVCEAQPGTDGAQPAIRELEQAKARAERQCAEANAELAAVRQSLRDVRRRFADQYLKNKKLQERLAALDWTAADLLQDGSDNKLPAEAYLLRQMEKRRKQQQKLHQNLVQLKTSFRNADSDEKRENVVSDESREQLDEIIELSRELAHQPPAVAGRGGDDEAHEVHVLAVNDDLQAVIINRGRTGGVSVASTWTPTEDSSDGPILKVIETGDQYSVAVPLRGSLRDIGAGASFTRQKQSAGSDRPQ